MASLKKGTLRSDTNSGGFVAPSTKTTGLANAIMAIWAGAILGNHEWCVGGQQGVWGWERGANQARPLAEWHRWTAQSRDTRSGGIVALRCSARPLGDALFFGEREKELKHAVAALMRFCGEGNMLRSVYMQPASVGMLLSSSRFPGLAMVSACMYCT